MVFYIEEKDEKKKIRNELENISRELDEINLAYEKIQRKIDKLPYNQLEKLRWLSDEKTRIYQIKNFLEKQKQEKTNLLNIIN